VDEKGNPSIAKEDVKITLENGETITIKAGESSGTATTTVNKDDVYKESDSISNSIKEVSGGESFEKLEADDTAVSTTISDDVDNVNIKIEPISETVVEGEAGKYKVTLTDDNGNPVISLKDMEVTFNYTYKTADGKDITETKTVTVPAGSSEVIFNVETTHNKYEVTPDSTGDTVLINTNVEGETGANYGSGNTYGYQTPPVVVSLGNGNVMYVWGDSAGDDNLNSKVFGKIYDANGHVVTDTFRIGDLTYDTSSNWDPVNFMDVKVLENGNVIVGYTSWDLSSIGQKPIVSIIDPTKQPNDNDFYIVKDKEVQQKDDNYGSPYESGPILTQLADGRILAIFVKGANSAYQRVYGRIMNEDGTFATDEFRVGNYYLEEALYNVNTEENVFVQELSNGNVVIGMKSSNNQPIFTVINSSGNTISDDIPAHSSNLSGNETAPRIIELADGKFMAVWVNNFSGSSNSYGTMYGRIFNSDGTPAKDINGSDSQFKIGDGSFYWNNNMDVPMLQFDYLTNGNIVIGWAKSGNPIKSMVTILDKYGKEVTNIQLEDSSHSSNTNSSYPIVKALGDGNFVAVWSDFSSITNQHIYYRIFDSEGNPLSDQILLSNSSTLDYYDNYTWDSISVDVIDDNSFVVGWVGDRYDSTDGSLTSVISVQVDLGKENDENLTISIDGVTNTDQFEKVTIDDSNKDLNIIDADTPKCSHSIMLSKDIDIQALAMLQNQEEVVVDLENKIDDYLIVDNKAIEDLTNNEEIIKIFGDESKEDRVKLEGNWEKSNTQETIDGEKFNVYQNGNSNIKILIDEDISVDPTI
ncbi:immunoglobulin-like domain-containing protein, partial [Malaciobacter mytili]|uniref:immunoglobulin-like domain-containing protein n=1 Tax=Malaciobacter mytili TaxID=603050 RepID=UPI003A89E7A0